MRGFTVRYNIEIFVLFFFKFMHEIAEMDKANIFQGIQSQLRGHSLKYHREISTTTTKDTISFIMVLQIYGTLYQII